MDMRMRTDRVETGVEGGQADRPSIGEKTLKINVIREPACVPMSRRMREVCWDFGIPPRESPAVLADNLEVTLRTGSLLFLTGPSGSGKSSILQAIAEKLGEVCWVGGGSFPTDRAVVDCIAPRRPLAEVLEILTACGLGEPRLWVRRYSDLSDGERFRAALARAVGQSLADGGGRPIVCDEFTAILHRRLAKALAYNLRKLVTRSGLILLAATTHDDILPDLRPDVIVRMGGATPVVETADGRPGAVSLQKRAVIEPGSVRDYARFAPMHYRHRDGLGFVDKVLLLRERAGGDPLGILVFAMAPAELSLRNRATEGRFVRNIRRLNQELRILRRLVMHPDVRGCGLGHWFVQRALPNVGVRFVECLAAMGAVNPVFEKSGMTRVGRCPLPRGRLRLLERMQKHHVDPFAPDFHRRIARCPRVRQMVEQTIHQWVAATTASQRFREKEHGPDELARCFRQLVGSPPIYYLWDREGRFPMANSIDRHENEPVAETRRDHHPDERPSRPVRPQRRTDPNRREIDARPDRQRHDPGRRE